jgi:CDP-diacylglycerol--serine O-phosphatidyltransferase
MKKHIPNTLTSANLFCGCIAIVQISSGSLVVASLFILLGALFDFFDGMAARLLKVSSPIGAELDSLADVITFGVAPAYIAYHLLQSVSENPWLPYFAFLLAVFSAVRLAIFNVDTRQTSSFIGLPTPANALFWISIVLSGWISLERMAIMEINWHELVVKTWVLIPLILLMSYLLVAEIPLFSLKFKNLNLKDNLFPIILVGSSFILFALMFFAAIPFILLLYLILSLIKNSSSRHEIQS